MSSPSSSNSSSQGSVEVVPTKKQRNHEPANFDNVQDEISQQELQGIPENERVARIVSWANWWFRPNKFLPADESLRDGWLQATQTAEPMPEDRIYPGGRPPLSGHEHHIIQTIRQSLVPVITRPFQDLGGTVFADTTQRPDANDFFNGYQHYYQMWFRSEQHQNLERTLQEMQIPFVDKIVAFGTGSPLFSHIAILMDLDPNAPSPGGHCLERHRQRFRQYAILMWMSQFFQQKHGLEHVQVYVQDPDLTATDEEAMEQLGIKILDGEYDCQEGFAKIDNSTFVYDAVISSSICQISMEYAHPAAVMTEHLDTVGSTMQDHHKYVYLDVNGLFRNMEQSRILWPQPLYPWCPTMTAYQCLKTQYYEVPLIDMKELSQERQSDNMPYIEFARQLYLQWDQEKNDWDNVINMEMESVKINSIANGTYPGDDAHGIAVYNHKLRKEKTHPVKMLHDLNSSGQWQLALYVRRY